MIMMITIIISTHWSTSTVDSSWGAEGAGPTLSSEPDQGVLWDFATKKRKMFQPLPDDETRRHLKIGKMNRLS